MIVANEQGLFVLDAHFTETTTVDLVISVPLELVHEFTELSPDVLLCFIILDPFLQLTLHILWIRVPALIDLDVLFLAFLVDSPMPISHLQLQLVLFVQEIVNSPDQGSLPLSKLLLRVASCLWVVLVVLIVKSLPLIPVEFLHSNCFTSMSL